MKRHAVLATILFACFAVPLCAQQPAASGGQTYQLKPTPKTVTWGYYDAKTPPVLRINSGDTVEIQTLVTSSPERFENAGMSPDRIEQPLRDIFREVKEKGPGVHFLTGPVYIEGAQPGDVLEVRIQKILPAIPYALNAFSPGRGFLPDDYPYARTKVVPLDEKRMVAHFADGIEVPMHPFFGSMGGAPPAVTGRISTNPPRVHGGNLDNKELVAGTILYIPIHTPGPLFHAAHAPPAHGTLEPDFIPLE